jgi:hypothetical protein
VKLTLFQHAWTARDYDPDGCAYGTEAEADAAEIRAARDLIGDDFSAEDLADAIEQHTSADDVSAERFAEIRAGADLTDEEAKMAAEELRGYDSAVYPTTVEIPDSALAALTPAPTGPTPGAALELGVVLARRVVENWAQGDLAGAVNALEEWADEVEGDFPDLDFSDDDEGDDDEADDEEPARDGMGARLDGLPG